MGYMHIDNLYKDQTILMFRECYALEKVHGTSAHIVWNGGLSFHSGGETHARFVALFDAAKLTTAFDVHVCQPKVIIYGEAYGGKQQGMRETYGADLRFIVFDVKIGDHWLAVPQMAQVADVLGLEVVPWEKTSTDLVALDAVRDRPSEVAVRRGITTPRPREGIVLRPLVELTTNAGTRIIAKHKGAAFEERKTPPKIVSPEELAVLSAAQAIADEWVTEMRLTHVLDKLPQGIGIERTPDVIKAMVEDVYREATGEIVESRDAEQAIRRKAAAMFKARLRVVHEPA